MVVKLRTAETEVAIDPCFIAVCEPGSIVVKSATPNVSLIVGAFVNNDSVVIRTHGHINEHTSAVITLSGIRRGRAGRRFPIFTDKQAMRNERFWSQAYGNET